MGSHFHDGFGYNGVAFSIELLECGRTFLDFWDKKVLHIHGYLWLASVPEYLCCRWKVKRSLFNLKKWVKSF